MIVIVPSDKYGNESFDRGKWEDFRIWASGVSFSPDNEKTDQLKAGTAQMS